jgi:hypothetical protein
MKPKAFLVVALTFCFISVVSAGLGMLTAIATPNGDFRNGYITPDGAWTRTPLDWQDQRLSGEVARSVGTELHRLRETRKLVIQSNNWCFLASVFGVLGALTSTFGIFRANKSVEPTPTR